VHLITNYRKFLTFKVLKHRPLENQYCPILIKRNIFYFSSGNQSRASQHSHKTRYLSHGYHQRNCLSTLRACRFWRLFAANVSKHVQTFTDASRTLATWWWKVKTIPLGRVVSGFRVSLNYCKFGGKFYQQFFFCLSKKFRSFYTWFFFPNFDIVWQT